MYLKILACDLDGTLAEDGHVAPATWDALRSARRAGLTLVLVTGRRLATFAADGPFAEVFEAIVAEDGAAVYFTRNDAVVLPFGRIAPEVTRRLGALDIPLERGVAIASTWLPHDEAVSEVLRQTGGSATVEYNKGAVMVLPPGATKGSGLRIALEELGYSLHNTVAVGDAENDRSLFEVVEYAVAVANAVPAMQELADVVLDEPDGAGSRRLIGALVDRRLPVPKMRLGRRLLLGHRPDEVPIYLSPFALLSSNIAIVGGSASGKSHLAGRLAEELLTHSYQVCMIDPEGDYSGLRAFPHTLVLGGPETPLPPVVDVITLSEYTNVSLILDLSAYGLEGRQAYVQELMPALCNLRARRGRPHWFLLDEVHSFCPPEGGLLTDSLMEAMDEGGFGLVSYRPTLVHAPLLDQVDHWFLTRMTLPEEVEELVGRFAEAPCEGLTAHDLGLLSVGETYLCTQAKAGVPPGLLRFQSARRVVPHVRHLHKYLRAPLPQHRRFYFHVDGGRAPQPAASLWEFRDTLAEVPVDTLRYHLERGDFERWLRDVLHDEELARRLRKIRHRRPEREHLRAMLVEAVADRYEELESLI